MPRGESLDISSQNFDHTMHLKNRKSFETMEHEDIEADGRESVEAAPLLEHEELSSPPEESDPRKTDADNASEIDKRRNRQRIKITVLVIAVTILVNLPGLIQDPPQLRILEDVFCKSYYQRTDPSKVVDGKIDEGLCKIELVQQEISTLKGWVTFTATLPGLFLAIPLGWWADKYGRKWLFVLNTVMMFQYNAFTYVILAFSNVFPVWVITLGSVCFLFGGGPIVALALLFVMLSDITPKAQLASVFFVYGGASRLSSLLGPSIAAYLMKNNPWIPLTFGLALQSLSIPVAFMIPETLGFKEPGESNANVPHRESSKQPSTPSVTPNLLLSTVRNIEFLGRDWRVLFLCSLYPFRVMENNLEGSILQLITTRYSGWTIANATYTYSIQAAGSLVVQLGILPLASSFITRRPGWSFRRKDIFLARVGLLFFSVGVLVIGIAPSMAILICGIIINTLGAGAGAAIRALVTGYVRPNEVGRLYTFITIVETAGVMLGGPIVAWLFNIGLAHVKAGGSRFWLGLPWHAIGTIVLLSAIALCLLRLEGKEQRNDGSEAFVVGQADLDDEIELEPLKKE